MCVLECTHLYHAWCTFVREMAQNGLRMCVFCARNGSVTPKKEGLAKQMQVMLLGGPSAEYVAVFCHSALIKLEPLL